MSQENVEIVRSFHAPNAGKDLVPVMREVVERLGPDPQLDAAVALLAEDRGWQHVHPDVVWAGPLGTAHGVVELIQWWSEWVEVWESYVFRATEYRDLGHWVLAVVDVRAQGRDGIPVEMRVFELYGVRDGKVAAYRSFLSEHKAVEAAGLSEQDAQADSS